jgi:hypothetical protein
MPVQDTPTTTASVRDIPVVPTDVVYQALPPRVPHAIYTMPLPKHPLPDNNKA